MGWHGAGGVVAVGERAQGSCSGFVLAYRSVQPRLNGGAPIARRWLPASITDAVLSIVTCCAMPASGLFKVQHLSTRPLQG